MHLMMLGQRNCNMLMQLAGRKAIFTVLRSDAVGGSIAHGWTFLPVSPIVVLNYFKKWTNTCISDIIHIFSFTYLNHHIL
jgi:hypothetical protein